MLPKELELALEHHVEFCTLSIERCDDCLFAHDKRAKSALATIRLEYSLIKDWLRDNPNICIYCSLESQDKDHLLPREWTGNEVRKYVPTVPSCHDCNIRISNRLSVTIAERAKIVSDSLRKKYKKSIDIPDRSEHEFQEYGRNLQDNLRKAQAFRQILRYRLRVLEAGGAHCVNLSVSDLTPLRVPEEADRPADAFAKANFDPLNWGLRFE